MKEINRLNNILNRAIDKKSDRVKIFYLSSPGVLNKPQFFINCVSFHKKLLHE